MKTTRIYSYDVQKLLLAEVHKRKIMRLSLFSLNERSLKQVGITGHEKVRKKSGLKPRMNTYTGKARGTPLPCFSQGF